MELVDLLEGFHPLHEVSSKFSEYSVIPTSQFGRDLDKALKSGKYGKQQKERLFADLRLATEAFKTGTENALPPRFVNHTFEGENPTATFYRGDFHVSIDRLHVFWRKYTKEPKVEFIKLGYPS